MGGVWRTAKRDSTGYCSSPPSMSSSLHGLLFIQPPPRATPPATVQPPLHGHPLHRLLFIQPSTPQGPVQPPLHGHPSTIYCSSSPPHHGVLFNHPSTGTPPPSTVQPSLHGVLFIQPSTGSCSSTPNWLNRSALVSSSSEGIARSGSVKSHRSIARFQ